MEQNNQHHIVDAFTKKYVKEIELESPSINFTATLMKKIEVEQKIIFNQEPLISKKGWFGIFLIIFTVILFSTTTAKNSWIDFPKLDFSFFSSLKMNQFFEIFPVSNATLIAFLSFGAMLIFQVLYLKNHFNKRFE